MAPTTEELSAWLPLPPHRVTSYSAAGISAAEAHAHEASGQAPDDATLSTLAALSVVPDADTDDAF